MEVSQARSARAILDGVVIDRSHIAGGARVVEFHPRALGASHRLFVQNPTQRNDPARSRFDMVRLDPAASGRSEPTPTLPE